MSQSAAIGVNVLGVERGGRERGERGERRRERRCPKMQQNTLISSTVERWTN